LKRRLQPGELVLGKNGMVVAVSLMVCPGNGEGCGGLEEEGEKSSEFVLHFGKFDLVITEMSRDCASEFRLNGLERLCLRKHCCLIYSELKIAGLALYPQFVFASILRSSGNTEDSSCAPQLAELPVSL
jgi:hypothetical protein